MENVRELYVILDKVAEAFGPIFEAPNENVAKRNYNKIISETFSPDDYELILVGYLDQDMNVVPALRTIQFNTKPCE